MEACSNQVKYVILGSKVFLDKEQCMAILPDNCKVGECFPYDFDRVARDYGANFKCGFVGVVTGSLYVCEQHLLHYMW